MVQEANRCELPETELTRLRDLGDDQVFCRGCVAQRVLGFERSRDVCARDDRLEPGDFLDRLGHQ